jgi:hypothetical protein
MRDSTFRDVIDPVTGIYQLEGTGRSGIFVEGIVPVSSSSDQDFFYSILAPKNLPIFDNPYILNPDRESISVTVKENAYGVVAYPEVRFLCDAAEIVRLGFPFDLKQQYSPKQRRAIAHDILCGLSAIPEDYGFTFLPEYAYITHSKSGQVGAVVAPVLPKLAEYFMDAYVKFGSRGLLSHYAKLDYRYQHLHGRLEQLMVTKSVATKIAFCTFAVEMATGEDFQRSHLTLSIAALEEQLLRFASGKPNIAAFIGACFGGADYAELLKLWGMVPDCEFVKDLERRPDDKRAKASKGGLMASLLWLWREVW